MAVTVLAAAASPAAGEKPTFTTSKPQSSSCLMLLWRSEGYMRPIESHRSPKATELIFTQSSRPRTIALQLPLNLGVSEGVSACSVSVRASLGPCTLASHHGASDRHFMGRGLTQLLCCAIRRLTRGTPTDIRRELPRDICSGRSGTRLKYDSRCNSFPVGSYARHRPWAARGGWPKTHMQAY